MGLEPAIEFINDDELVEVTPKNIRLRQRVLAEHALAAGQPLLAAELVPGNDAQRTALAVALWRAWSRDASGSRSRTSALCERPMVTSWRPESGNFANTP